MILIQKFEWAKGLQVLQKTSFNKQCENEFFGENNYLIRYIINISEKLFLSSFLRRIFVKLL